MNVIGIDPGKQGAFVVLGEVICFLKMPLDHMGEVHFEEVKDFLVPYKSQPTHVYLERAKPMAMGSKHAFNYGRDFAKLEIALKLSGLSTTYVEPNVWSKVMTEGISKDLHPKVRSRVAVERLFPVEIKLIPQNKNGKPHDGIIEALLIAGFGKRQLGNTTATKE